MSSKTANRSAPQKKFPSAVRGGMLPAGKRPGILKRNRKPSIATSRSGGQVSSEFDASKRLKLQCAPPSEMIYLLSSQEQGGDCPESFDLQGQDGEENQTVFMVVTSGHPATPSTTVTRGRVRAQPDSQFPSDPKTVVVHVEDFSTEGDEKEGADAQAGNVVSSLGDLEKGRAVVHHQRSNTALLAVQGSEDQGAVELLDQEDEEEATTSGRTEFVDINGKTWREIAQKVKPGAKARVPRWYLDQPNDRYHCLLCGECFDAEELYAHALRDHNYRLPCVGKSAFLKYIRGEKLPVVHVLPSNVREATGACPWCTVVFTRRLDLLAHIAEEHDRQYVLFDLEFGSYGQFEQWLDDVRREFKTGYTKNRTNVTQSGVKTQMYLCRMEEKPRKSKTYKTDRRAQNRTRAAYCTAHLLVRFLDNGRLHVRGSPTHIRHPVNMFTACRSLDEVPMEGLPGYAAVTSATAREMPKPTLETCSSILRKAEAIRSFVSLSPAPANRNIVRLLHSKLRSIAVSLSSYKFNAIVVQEDTGAPPTDE